LIIIAYNSNSSTSKNIVICTGALYLVKRVRILVYLVQEKVT